MLRFLFDSITRLICWFKRNHVIKPVNHVVKVNIGSGLTVAPEWINVDASPNALFSKWPRFILKVLYKISGSRRYYSQDKYCNILKNHVFIHHNVEYGIPFPDKSCDYMYVSHFLEHLFKEYAKTFLKEAYRVLKEKGLIRICIPNDLEYAVSLYRKKDKERAVDIFARLSRPGHFSGHAYMYDFDLLKHFLQEAGFTDIKRRSYRQGEFPDLDMLEFVYEKTLYVEAGR